MVGCQEHMRSMAGETDYFWTVIDRRLLKPQVRAGGGYCSTQNKLLIPPTTWMSLKVIMPGETRLQPPCPKKYLLYDSCT